jgi:putative transposase
MRHLVLSDRFFFVSCRLAAKRRLPGGPDFACLARVVRERRAKYRFLLTAWVFLPGHWHAIIYPRHPPTISTVMEAIKVGSTLRINARRRESGRLWQSRFFDRALRSVKEYQDKVEYIHLNPVKAGLVRRAGGVGRGRAFTTIRAG